MLQGDAEFASHNWERRNNGALAPLTVSERTVRHHPGQDHSGGMAGSGLDVLSGNRKLDSRLGQRMRGEAQLLLQAASRGRCGAV